MIRADKRVIAFQNRALEFADVVKDFDKEYNQFMLDTDEANLRISELIDIKKGLEHTFNKEYYRKYLKLIDEGTNFIKYRTAYIDQNTAFQLSVAEFYCKATKTLNSVNLTEQKKIANTLERLEEQYVPKAKKDMVEIREKMRLIKLRHDELKKSVAVFVN